MKKQYKIIAIKVFTAVLSFYLAISSFILIEIITNDIIYRSYSIYAQTKLNTSKVLDKVENTYQKGKVLFSKLLHSNKAKKMEENMLKEQKEDIEKIESMKNSLERKKMILSGLPYVLAIIVYIFVYVRTYEKIEKIFIRE